MNKSVTSMTAGIVIAVVALVAAGFVWWRGSQKPGGAQTGVEPPGIPAEAQRDLQRALGKGGITGPARK